MTAMDGLSPRERVAAWGSGYFGVDEAGALTVRPSSAGESVPVKLDTVVEELKRRGFRSPFLLRFPQLLRDRVRALNEGFEEAIREFDYPASYQGVYPIKVNQRRSVVEPLVAEGGLHRYGLEVGSKAELALALAQPLHPEALLILNGFKDGDTIELALRARACGTRTLIIAEAPSELDDILDLADEVEIDPWIGIRARLNSRGVGRWQESGGHRSKFGLDTYEILEALRRLEARGRLSALRCIHTHVGSQVTDIRAVKETVREAARLFCKVRKRAPELSILDLGGGLAVDYDGSESIGASSRNYDLSEYCRDCVYHVQEICSQEGVAPPTLVSESGRAVTAHHAVVVVTPVKVTGRPGEGLPTLPKDPSPQVKELYAALTEMNEDNARELLHDARLFHDELQQAFNLGVSTLEDRATGEVLFLKTCERALSFLAQGEVDAEEEAELRRMVAPQVICNFSVFQSTPDAWAVGQVFPVLPLLNLDDATVPSMLSDITCDSDGCLKEFPGAEELVMLPEIDLGAPGSIGIFLVGAYQDTLGDFHNLLGHPNEASIMLDGRGGFEVNNLHRGTRVSDATSLFGYDPRELVGRFEDRHGGDDSTEIRRYRDCFLRVLNSGTYLR